MLVCERAVTRYDMHVASVVSPRDDDVDPYTAATTGGGAAATTDATNQPPPANHAAQDDAAQDDTADADPPWRPLNAVDRRENGVPKVQQQFFASVLDDMASGTEYATWRRLDVP